MLLRATRTRLCGTVHVGLAYECPMAVLGWPPSRICSIKPKRRGTASFTVFFKTDSTNRGEEAPVSGSGSPLFFDPSFSGYPCLSLGAGGLGGGKDRVEFLWNRERRRGSSTWSAQMAPGWDPFGANGGCCWDGMLCRRELRLRGCDQRSSGGWPRDVQCCRAAVLPWPCSVACICG